MTTQEIWDKAAASIAPTKPKITGRIGLHPKMDKALDKFGWQEAATRELAERVAYLKAFCLENGIEY